MNNEERREEFNRNLSLEDLLKEVNFLLEPGEKIAMNGEVEELPLIFIVGPHRSGSTLMLQWLASTKQFAYPTNILSRFYNAPIIGSKIQLLLTDERYNFRNEIRDFNSEINFNSKNGKTEGALSPNEFWYFWRRFLPFDELDYATNEVLLDKVDIVTFKREFYGIAETFGKPFASKALICNYNIEFLNKIFEKALFIYTKRDPYTNIESALKARERQYGDINKWYSFKIPEYRQLIKIKDPIKQTAGQIFHIKKAVELGLDKIPEEKKIVVEYEEFCENPKKYYDEIAEKLSNLGYNIDKEYTGQKAFDITRKESVSAEIIKAYDDFKKIK